MWDALCDPDVPTKPPDVCDVLRPQISCQAPHVCDVWLPQISGRSHTCATSGRELPKTRRAQAPARRAVLLRDEVGGVGGFPPAVGKRGAADCSRILSRPSRGALASSWSCVPAAQATTSRCNATVLRLANRSVPMGAGADSMAVAVIGLDVPRPRRPRHVRAGALQLGGGATRSLVRMYGQILGRTVRKRRPCRADLVSFAVLLVSRACGTCKITYFLFWRPRARRRTRVGLPKRSVGARRRTRVGLRKRSLGVGGGIFPHFWNVERGAVIRLPDVAHVWDLPGGLWAPDVPYLGRPPRRRTRVGPPGGLWEPDVAHVWDFPGGLWEPDVAHVWRFREICGRQASHTCGDSQEVCGSQTSHTSSRLLRRRYATRSSRRRDV